MSTDQRNDRVELAYSVPGRPCSIAAALLLVGERWSLLAIREMALDNHRFEAIARNTGAPRDRLAARLRALEAAGVVERKQYSDHPPRYEYHLTDSGRDLRPVIHALRTWGDKWVVDDPPLRLEHICGHDVESALICRHCGREVDEDELHVEVVAQGWNQHGPMEAASKATR